MVCRQFVNAPVDAAELDKAKTLLIAGALRSRETVDGRGYAIGSAQWVQGDVSHVNDDIARLQAVTAADVQRVARRYLPDDRRVLIHCKVGARSAEATRLALRAGLTEIGRWDETLVATYDEFGRSPVENPEHGTHHGHASVAGSLARSTKHAK